ncbi:MAG TPA: iron-sulfur cluster insertion protein ErpA [Alphaproteobacteria bacterium]|nr:iron-sulfur cluster insertion protein ErpA [Alphaproteobacteria bacterium]
MTEQQISPSEAQETVDSARFAVTEGAARRVAALRAAEGNDALMLRITVSGGGCAGFQYGFDFDTEQATDDHIFERDGIKVVIDETSLDLLAGGVVDYKEDLLGSYFVIENPNATSSCGCGTSFSIG